MGQRRIRVSGQRPQRWQNSARLWAASARPASKDAARSAAPGGNSSQAEKPRPSWRARYRRMGPIRDLRHRAASSNSGRLAKYAKINSRMGLRPCAGHSPRARRQRPHWRQLFSRNSKASRRSTIKGPTPLSGIWARNSASTAPSPNLRHALEPARTGNTRNNASRTITIDPGVTLPPAFFYGGIFASARWRIQPHSCVGAVTWFPRLWKKSCAVDSKCPHLSGTRASPLPDIFPRQWLCHAGEESRSTLR
jgi:hypothetical protein